MTPPEDGPSGGDSRPLHERPAELLAELIRFDTTNPPGNERACIEFVDGLLRQAGVATETYAADADRPNLLARLPGGDAPPLLLYGHVDVVPTDGQEWTHPPFEGHIEGGFVWGRGALDMKAGVTMLLAAVLRAASEGFEPAGDVLLLVLADEEAGGDLGAGYMVDEHPELFEGVRYALGEFGGFAMEQAGTRFYPVQVDEKRVCWLRARFTGRAGHASQAEPGEAMARMANAVSALAEARLPVHVTPVVERMVAAMAEEVPATDAELLRGLLDPEQADEALAELDDTVRARFERALRNTANPTVVRGGAKENVVPGEVTLTLDCRLLPGQSRADVVRELRALWDDEDVEFETIRYEPWDAETDMGLFDLLADVLRDADPSGRPMPLLLTGATDGRHLARLGIQTYGFTPMDLPASFPFMEYVHAADERIPAASVGFGTDAVYEVLCRYRG